MGELSSSSLASPMPAQRAFTPLPTEISLPTVASPSGDILDLDGELREEKRRFMRMPLTSSPVLYPPSSSPPVISKKRKLFGQPLARNEKRARCRGGFPEVEEEITGDNEDTNASLSETIERASGLAPRKTNAPHMEEYEQSEETPDDFPLAQLSKSPSLPSLPQPIRRPGLVPTVAVQNCSGQYWSIRTRKRAPIQTFEQTIAQRSITRDGRAKKAYYGVDIHELLDEAAHQKDIDEAQAQAKGKEVPVKSVERPASRDTSSKHNPVQQMWTEKYRAKKFTELVGDERTHRSVLRWLKDWDPIVFPESGKGQPKPRIFEHKDTTFEKQHRKILLLTGPPGLGKTTLAHVCARQAGYEVLEINASDDRSRDVVKGRIKDALGSETVRGVKEHGKTRKAGRPVCVVVDEVDGVVTGNAGNGGEGGFIKALIDLVQVDQKNSGASHGAEPQKKTKRQGDSFKLLRPLILVCNDVYAPSLRPLRNSTFAEIVHVRKAPLDKVVARLRNVFESENIACETDAIRRLCESSWGLGTRKQNSQGGRGAGEGDIRGVLVQGEWIAHKLRATSEGTSGPRLTRKWIEAHLDGAQSGTGPQSLGRGGVREVVERIFIEGAGLPNLPTSVSKEEARLIAEAKWTPKGVAELRKRTAINALREMIDTCGDHERMMTDCFATYPTLTYQDDVRLSKPNAGYEWLGFHDSLSTRVFHGQEWELGPYLSTSACGFHHLFASTDKGAKGWSDGKPQHEEEVDTHPFSGVKADFVAYEAEKQNRAVLTEFQASFPASLLRQFRSTEAVATELVPNVGNMLSPEVKPIVVGGSGGMNSVASVRKETEKTCVDNAVRVMHALNVSFEKAKVEIDGGGAHSNGGFVYRMDPPLDEVMNLQLGKTAGLIPVPVRYAVRQVLDQELRKAKILQNSVARHARSTFLDDHVQPDDHDKENANGQKKSRAAVASVKRDFFGRIVNDARPISADRTQISAKGQGTAGRVWVSFNEGYSNAVRKPITLKELMESWE